MAAFEQGASPETIQQQYPTLSLEEVYGAITYYLAHRKQIQQYLRRQGVLWEKWRKRASKHRHPVVERLRSLRNPR
ncbi:MAG: DUF433 domain-containing protein [Verrucomicrobia bacterium]|nr:DUF433 domain-containing protein [Verrucomicrobiota bacterium]